MANTCLYEMRLAGKRQDVIDVLHIIHGDGPPIEVEDEYANPKTGEKTTVSAIENTFVGRCGYDSSQIKIIEKDGMMYADLDDECAWSVVSAMMKESNRPTARKSLEDLAEEYDVKMEVYSVEYGVGFSEYYFFPGKDIVENGYDEEDFNHEGISEALEEDGYHWDDDEGEWCDEEGHTVPNLFEDKVSELFPWDWHELCGEEWDGEGKEMNLLTFVTDYKGSWQ